MISRGVQIYRKKKKDICAQNFQTPLQLLNYLLFHLLCDGRRLLSEIQEDILDLDAQKALVLSKMAGVLNQRLDCKLHPPCLGALRSTIRGVVGVSQRKGVGQAVTTGLQAAEQSFEKRHQ